MIPNLQFYSIYLSNHFKIKSQIAAYFLDLNEDQTNSFLYESGLTVNHIEFIKTIKIDLIQAFYQSVESLFGLMSGLENLDSNRNIPDYLINAKIGDLHNFISSFEKFDFCYEYLSNKDTEINGKTYSKVEVIFYFITLVISDFPNTNLNQILDEKNVKGIAHILFSIANAFNREAHNSIKHGLRCMLIDKLNISVNIPDSDNSEPLEIPEDFTNFAGQKDVLLYYTKGPKGDNVATVVCVPINIKHILYLENSLNLLMANMMDQRDIVFGKEKPDTFQCSIFDYDDLIKNKFDSNSNFKSIRFGSPQ
ncbi:hypothetical protein [Mucilaginibacter sp.]|uniref:hypothetical protein n=1 Tax=Mucilaginibacter sp. TaxID=1882438 RepID=UPI003B00FE1D